MNPINKFLDGNNSNKVNHFIFITIDNKQIV